MSSNGDPTSSERDGEGDPSRTGTADPQTRIAIGLIAAPGLPTEIAEELAEELGREPRGALSRGQMARSGGHGRAGRSAGAATELIDAAHQRLLREDWELAICLTDLPLRIGRRAVAGHASPTHRSALVSVPALGPARVQRRALEIAIELLGILLGSDGGEPPSRRAVRACAGG